MSYPLTSSQKRFWFMSHFFGKTDTYNMSLGIRLEQALDIIQLKKALELLLENNPLLTVYLDEHEGMIQSQESTLPFIVESTIEDPNQLMALQHRHLREPFNLNQAFLWRLIYIPYADNSAYLYLVMHHLITDAWSMAEFFRKLSDIYTQRNKEQWFNNDFLNQALLTENTYHKDTERLNGDRQFWHRYLNQLIEPLTFLGRACASVKKTEASSVYSSLSFEQLTNIRTFSAERCASPFLILLIGFALLILRMSARKQCMIATMCSGREFLTNPHTLGCYANVLPLIFSPKPNQCINDYIEAFLNDWYEICEHQELPFQHILEAYRKQGQAESLGLDCLFIMQNQLGQCSNLFGDPKSAMDPFEPARAHAEFALFMLVRETDDGLFLSLQYKDALLSNDFAKHLLTVYSEIITSLCKNQNSSISSYLQAFPSDLQTYKVLNQQEAIYSNHLSLYELFHARFLSLASHTAIMTNTTQTTYQSLLLRVEEIASLLISNGAKQGDFIGISLKRDRDLVASVLAIWRINAAYVPVEPSFPLARKEFIIQKAELKWIICSRETSLHLEFCQKKRLIIDRGPHTLQRQLPPLSAHPMIPAYGLFTSGSTGEPKFIVTFQGNLLNFFYSTEQDFPKEFGHCVLAGASLAFDASIFELFTPLLLGGTLILVDNSLHYHDSPHKTQITSLTGTPSAIHKLLRQEPFNTKLRYIYLLGESVSMDLIEEIFQKSSVQTVYNAYGLTEASIHTTIHRLNRGISSNETVVPIGRPIGNNRMYVIDAEASLAPLGVVGELVIAGAGVPFADETVNQRLLPRLMLEPGIRPEARMLKTGDLGYVDTKGQLVCLGRTDTQIKLRGYRIELLEIEKTIRQFGGIQETAVVLKTLKTIGDTLICYFLAERPINIEALRLHIASVLPDYMIPTFFHDVPHLPRNNSGKIDKQNLQQRIDEVNSLPTYSANQLLSKSPETPPPHTLREDPASEKQILTNIWKKVLGCESIQETDSFFHLGGHSLLIPEMATLIQRELQVKIPIAEFFLLPTFKDLAQYITKTPSHIKPLHHEKPIATRPFSEDYTSRDVAIIGFSFRLPIGSNELDFWNVLLEKKSCIQTIPPDRWSTERLKTEDCDCLWGSFIQNIKDFDPSFFNLSLREAKMMDPQQRLLLEVAWEALEKSGYSPRWLNTHQKKMGVYIGTALNDYAHLLSQAGLSIDPYYATGTSFSLLANRISYLLGLDGPSLTVDTACSASLTALHLAVQAIRQREVDYAFVGSCALMLIPDNYIVWNRMGILAKYNESIAFDNDSTGFIPGEAIAGVIIKPALEAIQEGDTILGIIKGTATNHDGRTKVGLNATSPKAQANLIQTAARDACLSLDQLDYFETHGTGTRLGDAVEILGLREAVKEVRGEKRYPIGSLKSQLGHTGPVAGLIALLKVLLAFKYEILPGSCLNQLNQEIDFNANPFDLVTEALPWPRTEKKQVGISAFGFGGSNAHVIVESYVQKAVNEPPSKAHLFILSAKTPPALRQLVEQYISFFQESAHAYSIADICYTLMLGREYFPCRLAIIAKDKAMLLTQLQAFVLDDQKTSLFCDLPGEQLLLNEGLRFIQEGHIDTEVCYKDTQAQRRVPLPTYCFQRVNCWFDNTPIVEKLSPCLHEEQWKPLDPSIKLDSKINNYLLITKPNECILALNCYAKNLGSSIISADENELKAESLHLIFWVNETLTGEKPLQQLFALLKKLCQYSPLQHARIILITQNAIGMDEDKPVNADAASLWPMLLSAERELKTLSCQWIDIQEAAMESPEFISQLYTLLSQRSLKKVVVQAQTIFIPEYRLLQAKVPVSLKVPDSVYWITGGFGEIALALAEWLLTHTEARIVLLGRRKKALPSSFLSYKERYLALEKNVCSLQDMQEALAITNQLFGPVNSVFHLAGIMQLGTIKHKHWDQIQEGIAAKIDGCHILSQIFEQNPSCQFVFFSSLSAYLGSGLLAEYAAANAYLNAYAHNLNLKGRKAISISWCGWQDIGMGTTLTTDNDQVIKSRDAFILLDLIYKVSKVNVIVASPLSLKGDKPSSFQKQRPIPVEQAQKEETCQWQAWLQEQVILLTESFGQDFDTSRSFMEQGIDSILAAELVHLVNKKGSLKLNPRIFFEYPNVSKLAAYLESQKNFKVDPKASVINSVSPVKDLPVEEHALAIIGIACDLPGSPNYHAFWLNLLNQQDLVTEKTYEELLKANAFNVTDERYSGHRFSGGFLEHRLEFPADLFQISGVESDRMQDQQKLFLQLSYSALENAGYSPESVAHQNIGVFVGAMPVQQKGLYQSIHPHTLLSQSNAILANRVSYFFNFTGPSVTVDTLCSSSLVALHAARQSILAGECRVALVGGVRLGLDPEYFQVMQKMGALSPTGKCRSFSAEGDGFVPAEGGVVLIVKAYKDALADGDHVWAMLRGTAMNHGGRGNGLTAPNPDGQADVILRAMKSAKISAQAISYIEAHGTGTQLGDPVELSGLVKAFEERSKHEPKCALGSVKSNVGHLEPAAGLVGVLKVILAMKHQKIPATLHLSSINPYLQLDDSPFYLVDKTVPWLSTKGETRKAGVSAFGIGGTNAHAILEEAPTLIKKKPLNKPQLFLLSARNKLDLLALINAYIELLQDEVSLSDLCFTLAVGRKQEAFRLATVIETRAELIHFLQDSLTNLETSTLEKLKLFKAKRFGLHVKAIDLDWACIKKDYTNHQAFANLIHRCDQALKNHSELSLLALLFDPNPSNSKEESFEALTLFCVLYAYGSLIQEYSKASLVTGEGIGIFVASSLSGQLSLEEAIIQILANIEPKQSLISENKDIQWLNIETLSYLELLKHLYLKGVPLPWAQVFSDENVQRIPLPNYPFRIQQRFVSENNQTLLELT